MLPWCKCLGVPILYLQRHVFGCEPVLLQLFASMGAEEAEALHQSRELKLLRNPVLRSCK